MKVILMNQNTKILSAEMDNANNFTQIYEYYNLDYAPLQIYNAYYDKSKGNLKELNHWFQGRGIPSWRQDVSRLLEKLNVSSPQELLNKAYGLSLSDQYWIKEENQQLVWEDINFFDNDFEYKSYLEASLSRDSSSLDKISLHSPNNTTDGMVKKGWIIDETGNRVLIKGTYSLGRLEPINEWLASQVCERLGINHVNYTLDIINSELVCKCANFLTHDEEIISTSDILELEKKSNNINDYEHYINILESKGIEDAKSKLSDMYLVDYLLMNTDRHLKNYGIIRNVKTLKWVGVTPIFDTGNSLESDKTTIDLNFDNDSYKFFHSRTTTLNDLLKFIDIQKYDLTKLDGLADDLSEMLKKYKNFLDLSEERYKKTIDGFSTRINSLEKYKELINDHGDIEM